jgi:hypothetical protein
MDFLVDFGVSLVKPIYLDEGIVLFVGRPDKSPKAGISLPSMSVKSLHTINCHSKRVTTLVAMKIMNTLLAM